MLVVEGPSPERFLEACGSAGLLRLGLEGPGVEGTECRTFYRPFAVIGRDSDADFRLRHPDVSRRHAYFQMVAGRVFCVDLRSRTKTHWGSGPGPWGWVGREGVRIGPFRIRPWQDGPEGDLGAAASMDEVPPPTARTFEHPGLAEATLEFLDAGAEQAPWRISRALVLVGRSRACKVQLTGPEVSSFHCSLVRTPDGVWVVDLLGREGTLVNGTHVRSARLDDGDELRVGVHRIRLRRGAPPARSPRPLSSPARPGWQVGDLATSAGTGLAPIPEVGRLFVGRSDLPDSLLVPLLNEFGQMQQQMADQFQQALMMMFQMFSGMHQDQMTLIREELGRIGQLTREQQALHAELARHTPASGDRPALRLVLAEGQVPPPCAASEAEPAARPDAPAGVGAGRRGPAPGPGDAAPDMPREAPGRPRPSGGPDAEDIHAALIRRLAAIQEERQGRWQKLINSVVGRGSGGTQP